MRDARLTPALIEARATADAIPRAGTRQLKRTLQQRLVHQLLRITAGKAPGRQCRLL